MGSCNQFSKFFSEIIGVTGNHYQLSRVSVMCGIIMYSLDRYVGISALYIVPTINIIIDDKCNK